MVGTDYNLSLYINKEQYFESIPKGGLGIPDWSLPGDGKIFKGQKGSKTIS